MGVLNNRQFAARVNQGGASRRLIDNSEPLTGDMVSIPGHERVLSLPVDHMDVLAHRARMALSVRAGGAIQPVRSYQGGWVDHDQAGHPWAYLDHSWNLRDRPQALRVGHAGHQIAIYDVHKQEEIRLDPARHTGAPPADVAHPGSYPYESLRGLRRKIGDGPSSAYPRGSALR